MHASGSLLTSAALLLLLMRSASAAPGPKPTIAPRLAPRDPASPTDVWVSVDDSGNPKTITPVLTTVDGTTSVISGAPHDLTASVYTQTKDAIVSTSTGDPPNPTATDTAGAGAFSLCHNTDGTNAPFCRPDPLAQLNPGTTYYVTWDPTFFNGTNTTVTVQGNYINSTTGAVEDQAFASPNMPAAWAFYAWAVDKSLMKSGKATNISLTIAALGNSSSTMSPFTGPLVTVMYPPAYEQPPNKPPTGKALYIGLPTVFGFIVLMVVGTFLWNRKTRRINIGSVMGRGRDGYGVGKSRARRMRRDKKEGIALMEREVVGPRDMPPEQRYRDVDDDDVAPRLELSRGGGGHGWDGQGSGRVDEDEFQHNGVPRRDSDALGSLAGTPTEAEFPRSGRGNAFRDELSRQDMERL